jgi:hypothetical protein
VCTTRTDTPGRASDATGTHDAPTVVAMPGDDTRSPWPWVVAAVVVGLALSAPAPLAGVLTGGSLDPMDLMSDAVEVTGIAWHAGAVASLNLFVWAAGAGVFLVAAIGLRRRDASLAAMLLALGLLSLVLTLDDRFLLHEVVLPHYLGVPELVTYGLYAVAAVAVLVAFREVFRRLPETGILLFAIAALAVSVGLDLTGWDSLTRRVAEETFKMVGAVAWAAFPAAVVVRHLEDAPATAGAGVPSTRVGLGQSGREHDTDPR